MNTDNNRIIGGFLGKEVITEEEFLNYTAGTMTQNVCIDIQLKYHSDYNWLIPAIGKLNEEMKSSLFKTDVFSKISSMILVNDISGAYQCFIEALKFHNQQSK